MIFAWHCDSDLAVRDASPKKGLARFQSELPADAGGQGHLPSFGQGCQHFRHGKNLSCNFIMSMQQRGVTMPEVGDGEDERQPSGVNRNEVKMALRQTGR